MWASQQIVDHFERPCDGRVINFEPLERVHPVAFFDLLPQAVSRLVRRYVEEHVVIFDFMAINFKN